MCVCVCIVIRGNSVFSINTLQAICRLYCTSMAAAFVRSCEPDLGLVHHQTILIVLDNQYLIWNMQIGKPTSALSNIKQNADDAAHQYMVTAAAAAHSFIKYVWPMIRFVRSPRPAVLLVRNTAVDTARGNLFNCYS